MTKRFTSVLLLMMLFLLHLPGCGGGNSGQNSTHELISISVTPTNPTIAINTSLQLIATGTYSDNTTEDLTSSVSWSSSDSMKTTIDQPGIAYATAVGESVIRATLGNVSGETTLTVTPTTSVTLALDAPTLRPDGSPLNPSTDFSKYRIYYGTSSNIYTQSVDIANPGTTPISFTLRLEPGTYYIVVTCVDISGRESDYSNEVSKTILP
jgi:hypothetical protein